MDEKGFIEERMIAVGVSLKGKNIDSSMKELEALIEAAGGSCVASITQNRQAIENRTYIGKGKIEEIRDFIAHQDVDAVVFNHELSGSQIRNIEEAVQVKVLDRTALILDIFASRAHTKEGKLQVQLAQANYRLPRLAGYSNYLSRQGGGIGTRGPGEQKLEMDRRIIAREIANIKEALEKQEKNRELNRKAREKNTIPVVSLVGYTNVGKSSIMNAILERQQISGKEVLEKDQLFATLDTSHRKVNLPNGKPMILADTIGFISDIPIHLIEAFKSTLEESVHADLVLHIIDRSNEEYEEQRTATVKTLTELGVNSDIVLEVYNKMDLVHGEEWTTVTPRVDSIEISSKRPDDIEKLLSFIEQHLYTDRVKKSYLIPYRHQDIIHEILENNQVSNKQALDHGFMIEGTFATKDLEKYERFEVHDALQND